MANGDVPSCNGCQNFRGEAADPTKTLSHVRELGARFFCLLHEVVLPFQQTDKYLVCRDWKHSRTGTQFGSNVREKYDDGTLYVYESEYAPECRPFAKFSDLPAMSKPEGNP